MRLAPLLLLLLCSGTFLTGSLGARVNYGDKALAAFLQKRTEMSHGGAAAVGAGAGEESGLEERPSQIQCAKGGNKRYPDPKDENKFFMCTYSSAHRVWMVFSFSCPRNTVFDGRARKCSRKEAAASSSSPQALKSSYLLPHQKGAVVTVRPGGRPGAPNNSNNKRLQVQYGTRFAAAAAAAGSSSSSPSTPVKLPAFSPSSVKLRLPLRGNQQEKVSGNGLRTRPNFIHRYPNIKIPYPTPAQTRIVTSTTPTTTTTTSTTPLPEMLPPFLSEEDDESDDDQEEPLPTTKHVSAIRDFASRIADIAQTLETLLTSLESSNKPCEEKNGTTSSTILSHHGELPTTSLGSTLHQIVQAEGAGQSGPSSSRERDDVLNTDEATVNEEDDEDDDSSSFLSRSHLNEAQHEGTSDDDLDSSVYVPAYSSEEPEESKK